MEHVDLKIILEDSCLIFVSVRFWIRIVAFCMIIDTLLACLSCLQTMRALLEISGFANTAFLGITPNSGFTRSEYSA